MSAGTRRRRGFTLIELIAVVGLIGLLALLAYPNLGLQRSRTLLEQARQLTADLELARQRSVVTGVPHRVQIDLEGGRYWVEWRVSEAVARGEPEPAETPEPEPPIGPDTPIDLSPPRDQEAAFYPLPDQLGRVTQIADDLFFEGVETSEGLLDRGIVSIAFERDGSAQPGEIVLSHLDGGVLVLEVRPLAEAVRIRNVSG